MSKIIKITNLTDPSKGEFFQSGDFVEYEYENGFKEQKHYYGDDFEHPEDSLEVKIEIERLWRDSELKQTDFISPITDHPNYSAYMTYRQELRDYPSQPDFPNGTRPVKP
jgi:hypothetical protein